MSEITAFKGADILVKISTGVGDNTLVAYCSINSSRGIGLTAETTGSVLPDCDDPYAAGWKSTNVTGLSLSVSGAGVSHKPDVKVLADLLIAGQPVNGSVEVGGSGGTAFTGKLVITSLNITGDRTDNAEFDIAFESDGEIVTSAIV